MVPSSPYGPCRTGSTTSTSPSTCGIWPGALATTCAAPRLAQGTTAAPGSAIDSTEGSSPSVMTSLPGSSATCTQLPSRVMPIGTTSYTSRSIALSMLPPPMQDTACSGPLPPNTTATLILRSLTVPPAAGAQTP